MLEHANYLHDCTRTVTEPGRPLLGSQMLETVTISAATARNESQAEQRFSVPVRDLVTFLFANWK